MPPRLKAPGAPLAIRKRTRGGLGALLVVIAIGVGLGALLLGSRKDQQLPAAASAPEARRPPPPADVSALLDGLTTGDSIGAWNVHVIRIVDKQIGIDLIQGDQVMTVWVAKKSGGARLPPRQTERYDLFFGVPSGGQATNVEPILAEIERRIRRTESSAPIPTGL